MRFIAEFGSCHQGKMDPIKTAIDWCGHYGIDALKLQLFPKKPPFTDSNIHLSFAMFEKAFKYAIDQKVNLSASVFGQKELDFILQLPVPFVKIAYSEKHQKKWISQILNQDIEAIVSCDVLSEHSYTFDVTKLLCDPFYPVPYIRDFKEMFPRFEGYSDHTIGLHQTEAAIHAGAKVIEKHVRLGTPAETCPDAQFAVKIKDFGEFIRKQRDKAV